MRRIPQHRSRSIARLALVVLVGVVGAACGSSSTSPPAGTGGSAPATGTGGSTSGVGTGGASTTAGTGGKTAGSGGTTATGSGGAAGGATGAGGGSVAFAMCLVAPKNKAACTPGTDTDCSNTCGPNRTGFKNCTCSAAITPPVWNCPTCEFPANANYTCYKLPAAENKCPADPTDTVTNLIQSNSLCTAPACMPCGSATLNSYRDSAGTPKIGYCVCVAGTTSSKWSCASTSEWPPQ